MDIECFAERVHRLAEQKGWWERSVYSEGVMAEKLLNIHAEVSEASEEARRGYLEVYYGEGGKPEGTPIEIADIIIRSFDLLKAMGVSVEGVLQIKANYNETRPYRHGGKAY